MIDKEQDLEPAQVRWERRKMMVQFLSSTALLWNSKGRARWLAAALWVGSAHAVFGNTRGLVQSFGPVFWYHERLRRVPGQHTWRFNMTRRIDWRSMFEEEEPYRVGKGLAVRFLGKLYMVGYCRRRPPQQELVDQNGLMVDYWEYEAAE